jgi:hypothetical protein
LKSPAAVDCCSSARALSALIERAPAAVVQIRVLPIPSMFPGELRDAAGALPFEVRCAVAPPSVAETAGVTRPQLGELLIFSGGRLLGRIPPEAIDTRERLLGLLTAGLAPWLGRDRRRPVAAAEPEETDPFAVIGVPASAAFDEVHAAWRQKLAEYHPDRFMRAGEKIRTLANTETKRINAAFQTIARDRVSRSRS